MEFYPDLYKRAFSRLTASPEKMQEVFRMTENKRKPKLAKRALVAAAIAVMVVATAIGANAASGGKIFSRVTGLIEYAQTDSVTGSQKCLIRMENDYGEEIEFLAEKVEYYPERGVLRAYFSPVNGGPEWLELDVDREFRQYDSFQEMQAKAGTITGTAGENGGHWSLEQAPAKGK